jgi:hypothetical protein
MPNYFDYMLESADSSIDDMDDCDVAESVYNEMDASMCEFDSYVQEGVGVAIAAGVGGAALIGGLIALIAKCFGNSSSNSAARAAKEAQKAIDNTEELPEEGVEVPTPEAVEKVKEEVRDNVQDFIDTAQAVLDNSAKKNSETGIEKPEQTKSSTGKKVGTKTVHSKEEAKEAFKQEEQASKEIAQMNKDLKTKQRELQKATESGKVKVTDEQKKQLEAKRNKAAKAVNAGSNVYRKSANNVLGKLEAGARKIGKFIGI